MRISDNNTLKPYANKIYHEPAFRLTSLSKKTRITGVAIASIVMLTGTILLFLALSPPILPVSGGALAISGLTLYTMGPMLMLIFACIFYAQMIGEQTDFEMQKLPLSQE